MRSEEEMQFFIALGLLVTLSSAYLLHQFWSRALEPDDAQAGETRDPDAEPSSDTLKAA